MADSSKPKPERWTRTNSFATPRSYTEGESMYRSVINWLENDALCLIERGDTFLICHRDDVHEIEKVIDIAPDVFANKVERVTAWIQKSSPNLDSFVTDKLAKDLIKAGFEALPDGVYKAQFPCIKCQAYEVWVEEISDHPDLRLTCQACGHVRHQDGPDA